MRYQTELENRWIGLGELSVHARVSAEPAPTGALPVVLVHGIGVASQFMVPLARALAPYHRVYAPDLPGFGESGKPSRILTLKELTDSLASWTRACGIERAAFLGNSFGCQIVADLAVRYPELVELVVLQGPTMDPHARSSGRQVWRWLKNAGAEHPSQARITARAYRRCGAGRLLKTFRYALEDRVEERLPSIRVPALVVRGSRDPIVPQRWAEEVSRLLPMGRLAIIPRGPHTLVYNRPLELACVAGEFLERA